MKHLPKNRTELLINSGTISDTWIKADASVMVWPSYIGMPATLNTATLPTLYEINQPSANSIIHIMKRHMQLFAGMGSINMKIESNSNLNMIVCRPTSNQNQTKLGAAIGNQNRKSKSSLNFNLKGNQIKP